MTKIAIGNDHAGTTLKQKFVLHLQNKGFTVTDKGTYGNESVDYPDFAHPVANAVTSKECELGILICGSGNGVCMTANKHNGIQAALAWEPEIAALGRQHNNANILCIPARFLSTEKAITILDAFLDNDFEAGRHQRRVDKMNVN